MGARGPVPKRSQERRRRNVEGGQVEQVEVGGPVVVPELPDTASPLARELFEALASSGQAQFYEPSDWWLAKLMAVAVDDYLDGRKSATKLAEIRALATELMMSEGQRRRLRLELVRDEPEGDSAGVTALDAYRKMLG